MESYDAVTINTWESNMNEMLHYREGDSLFSKVPMDQIKVSPKIDTAIIMIAPTAPCRFGL